MWHGPPERRRNTRSSGMAHVLCNERGDATLLLGIFGVVLITFFIMMMFQKQELHVVTGDVSSDITAVLTTTASSQLTNSYAPIRDGTSGAVMFNGVSYREIKNTDKFLARFAELYKDVELRGDDLVKTRDGRTVFVISDLRLYVSNASGGEVKSYYRAEYTLSVANGFFWAGTNAVLRNQVQTIEYMNRF